jgi:PKD repeat protein
MRKYYLLLILLGFTACKKDEIKPLACFFYTPDSLIYTGDTIIFSNCSENTTSYFWDFGDGNTSTENTPHHIYETPGSYLIKLYAANDNNTDSISKLIIVADQYYTDLNDTLLRLDYGEYTHNFDFDIDQDGLMDLSILLCQHLVTSYGRPLFYIQLIVMNGYEINVSNYIETTWTTFTINRDTIYQIDTVLIPKLHDINDTIYYEDEYSSVPIMLEYRESPAAPEEGRWSGIRRILLGSEYKYIAFRKISDHENTLAWLKAKDPNEGCMYGCICLNSCKFFNNQDRVIIKEEK